MKKMGGIKEVGRAREIVDIYGSCLTWTLAVRAYLLLDGLTSTS